MFGQQWQAGIGNFGVEQIELFEMFEPAQVGQPGVGGPRPGKVQILEPCERFQMHQAGPRHAGVVQREPLELLQPAEVSQSGVGDPGLPELEHFKLRQACDLREAGVGDLRQIEVQPAQVGQPAQVFEAGIAPFPGDDVEGLPAVAFFHAYHCPATANELSRFAVLFALGAAAEPGQRRGCRSGRGLVGRQPQGHGATNQHSDETADFFQAALH